MDGNNSNQNNNVFRENCCINCRDPKSGQKELSVISRLIQYSDFIQDERLRLHLSHSKKMVPPLKFIALAKRQLLMKCSIKEILFQQHRNKIRRLTRSDVMEFSWKTHCFYCGYC